METSNFRKLDIYKISESLADEIWAIVNNWNNLAKETVGRQIIRSADSIGANIAEGSGRTTPVDNRRFLRIARGSLYETRHWLRRACRRKLLTETEIAELSRMVDSLTPKLNAYIGRVNASAGLKQDQDRKSKIEDRIEA